MPDIAIFIATVLSIIAGCISIWQAYLAKSQATKAEKYRDEIVLARKAVDISSIETVLSRTINLISKYGPAAATSSLLGVNPQTDAEEVQNFITVLRKNKQLFKGRFSEIDKLCNKLSELISELVAAHPNSTENMKLKGTEIYHLLTGFSPSLKGDLDKIKEHEPN